MRRVSTLVAMTAVALSISADRASAAISETTAVASRDAAPRVATVTAVSVEPAGESAHVVLALSGDARVTDFMLSGPDRLVVDLTGARLDASADYDGVERAGITDIRLAQFQADIVRLVIELDGPRSYRVERAGDALRIVLQTEGAVDFAAWHTSRAAVRAASTGALAADAVATAIAPPADLPLASPLSQQPRITVTYQDSEIRDVIAGIATYANRTIVVGKDVQGTVTAEIKDQPWDVALQAILAAQGLAASEEASGIIVVDSYSNILAKQASEPVTTQLVSINYANASALVGTISSLLSKDCPSSSFGSSAAPAGAEPAAAAPAAAGCLVRGSVTADTATNTLVVTEVKSRLPELLSYIKDLDIRTPQVALKAKVIAISRTQTEQLGLSYDLGTRDTHLNTLLPRIAEGGNSVETFESRVGLGGDALATVANASRRFKQGAALNMIFTTALGNYSLTSFLDALKENNLSDVQAEPSVVTLDNRMASILVGQETPIRVIDAGSASQIGQPARANVQFKESGIILKVTPHITSNRQIKMEVEAEQSALRVVGGDLGFFFDKNNAQTQLLVADGETAVIGGLTQTTVTRNKSGIPFLVDLPLLGKLFSQSSNVEEKRDLLILITPHIIDEGEAVRPPSGGGR
ncbi:MAG TPA: AMIN domain-containing protein [Gemmatimonadaceae bacterium]|nr:AMIN domain-containing protein [Gemmatimonadaceae bacterium]